MVVGDQLILGHESQHGRRRGRVPFAAGMLGLLSLCATVAGQCDPAGEIFPDVNPTYEVGVSPHSVAIDDLDGDGDLDLVVANMDTDDVSVLIGNGDGTFAGEVRYDAGDAATTVAIDDLDGDGDLDLVVANMDTDDVSVLMGHGDGTFADEVRYDAGNASAFVTIGDFDADGVPDLAVANFGSEAVSVLMGNGDGTFAADVEYDAGIANSVAIADLDLAAANHSKFAVSVLLNNGDGTFAVGGTYDAGDGAFSVAIGDLNDDGAPDLAVTNRVSAEVIVLLNQCDFTGCPWDLNANGIVDGSDIFRPRLVGTRSRRPARFQR